MPYRRIDCEIWVDDKDVSRPVPTKGIRLSPSKNGNHAALRLFVFHRDEFTCQKCGVPADYIPLDYDGSYAPATSRKFKRSIFTACLNMDHHIAISRGGTNHPDNFRTLCECCNKSKGVH